MGGEEFFPYDDDRLGDPRPYFQWPRGATPSLVVQHPLIRFDPASAITRSTEFLHGHEWIDPVSGEDTWSPWLEDNRTLILVRKYELQATLNGFMPSFQVAMEKVSGISEDRFLWQDTGFWSAFSDRNTYIGIGEGNLEKTLQSEGLQLVGYVLISTSTILAFVCDFQESTFRLEAILNNRFIPFAEQARKLDRALSSVCEWKMRSSEVTDVDSLHVPPADERLPSYRTTTRNDESESFSLDPVAVISAIEDPTIRSYWYFMAVFPKPPVAIPFRSINEQDFVLAEFRASFWDKKEFARKLIVSGTQTLFLEGLVVVAWTFDRYLPIDPFLSYPR